MAVVQGYLLGNPTTDSTIDYMRAELYQGMSLIPAHLVHDLERASCPAHSHKKEKVTGETLLSTLDRHHISIA